MYKPADKHQITFFDFNQSFGIRLDADNEWVRLAERIDWTAIEKKYAALFRSHTGHPARPLRMMLGALIVQERSGLSDRALIRSIAADPYLQYFIGLTALQTQCPFQTSSLTAFRARMRPQLFLKAGALSAPHAYALCNAAREHLEDAIDLLHRQNPTRRKPRTYRRVAQAEYRAFMKTRRHSAEQTRETIHSQLGYLRRDLRHVGTYLAAGGTLPEPAAMQYRAAAALYAREKALYEAKDPAVRYYVITVDKSGQATWETTRLPASGTQAVLQDALQRDFVRTGHIPSGVCADTPFQTAADAGGAAQEDGATGGNGALSAPAAEQFFGLPAHFSGVALLPAVQDDADTARIALSVFAANLFAAPRRHVFRLYVPADGNGTGAGVDPGASANAGTGAGAAPGARDRCPRFVEFPENAAT